MDILYLIHELEAFLERHKKSSVRIAIIQTLERIVQPFNYWVVESVEIQEPQNTYESTLWAEVINFIIINGYLFIMISIIFFNN